MSVMIGPLNLEQLTRIYLVANTPSYLYRNYRSDSSVLEFSKINSVGDLVTSLSHTANIPASERSLNQIVVAYACLSALTFKNHNEVTKALYNKTFDSINWAGRMLELWETWSSVTTHRLEIEVLPYVNVPHKMSESGNLVIS
jgi:hypothetical protein